MRPTSRTTMAPCRSCGPSGDCSPNCATSSPIVSIAVKSCSMRCPISASGRSKSSRDRRASEPSKPNLGAGWLSAPLPGSDATAASPKTLRPAFRAPRPGSLSQASACSRVASQGLEIMATILSQTLRMGSYWVPRICLQLGPSAPTQTVLAAQALQLVVDPLGEAPGVRVPALREILADKLHVAEICERLERGFLEPVWGVRL